MVVAGVVVLGGGKLLGSGGLGRGVQVLNLGLTEDTVGTRISIENLDYGMDSLAAAYM